MACECLKTVEQNITKIVQKRKPMYVISEGGFANETIPFTLMGGLCQSVVLMPFEYRYTFEKVGGDMSKEKKGSIPISPTYCPFCGVKIKEDVDEDGAAAIGVRENMLLAIREKIKVAKCSPDCHALAIGEGDAAAACDVIARSHYLPLLVEAGKAKNLRDNGEKAN